MSEWQAVLFDLDGTLADTAPDLIHALNRVREELGYAAVPEAQVRPAVSQGGAAMLRAGFRDRPGADVELLKRFLDTYRERICVDTRLFEGMDLVLERLESRGIAWGIVTNKPGWLTEPLVEALGLHQRVGATVSGDTLPVKKPDPAPVLHACRAMGVDPRRVAMVGDDRRDIEAGQAAGGVGVVAAWGYIGADECPDTWGATHHADQPLDVLRVLGLD